MFNSVLVIQKYFGLPFILFVWQSKYFLACQFLNLACHLALGTPLFGALRFHQVQTPIKQVTIITYTDLSHALKNTANQRPGLPLHILRYAINGKYSTLLSRHYLRTTVYWGLFEDFSKASSETLQLLRTSANICDHVRKFSEDFRTLLKISEDFPEI